MQPPQPPLVRALVLVRALALVLVRALGWRWRWRGAGAGAGAGGVVRGVVPADVDVVVTTGATMEVVVVVVW